MRRTQGRNAPALLLARLSSPLKISQPRKLLAASHRSHIEEWRRCSLVLMFLGAPRADCRRFSPARAVRKELRQSMFVLRFLDTIRERPNQYHRPVANQGRRGCHEEKRFCLAKRKHRRNKNPPYDDWIRTRRDPTTRLCRNVQNVDPNHANPCPKNYSHRSRSSGNW